MCLSHRSILNHTISSHRCKFVDHLIDLNIRDSNGRNALMFLQLAFNLHKPIKPEIITKLMKKLIKSGINAQDLNGYAALHHAVIDCNLALAMFFCENGSDIHMTCVVGQL
jgi:ankyrin repeat protein